MTFNEAVRHSEEPHTYENDIDVAHAVASILDQLIEQQSLTREVLNNATAEQIDEFTLRIAYNARFDPQTQAWQFNWRPEALRRKIRQIFEPGSFYQAAERGPNREQLIIACQNVLQILDNPRIVGIILYGSRMDPGGRYDANSDVDMAIVTDSNDKLPFTADPSQVIRILFDEQGVDKRLIGGMNVGDIQALCNAHGVYYALYPDRLQYVAADGSQVMNEWLQKFTKSEAAQDLKAAFRERCRQLLRKAGQ